MTTKNESRNLDKDLKELSGIADWFDEQEEVNVEEGLKKVKRAVELIKHSKKRLSEVENEFEEIKKEMAGELSLPDDEDA